MSAESEYILQKRLPYLAGALRVAGVQELLTYNGLAVTSLPECAPTRRLDADEDHLLRKAAAGLSGREIMLDRERRNMPALSHIWHNQVRERLYELFNAENTPHLVAIAGHLGYTARSSLLLKQPQLFTAQYVVGLGLLKHGFPHTDISGIFKVDSRDQMNKLFKSIKEKLPATEIPPYRASAAWLVNMAQRLDILPRTRRTLERFNNDELYEGIFQILQPEHRFRIPPPNSSIALAATPFKYRIPLENTYAWRTESDELPRGRA